ncbi:MAG: hypothetical protein ACOX6G_03280 [Christensenellales bacterium]|jgi:hypothetical protein
MKKLVSMLLALAMLLSLTVSFAQEQPQNLLTTVLSQSDKNAVYDSVSTITLDAAALSELMMIQMMLDNEFGDDALSEEMQAEMQEEQERLRVAFAAVNKARMEGRQSYTDATGVLKTDDGVLFTFATSVDSEEGVVNVTTDLLPDVYFQIPEEMLKQDQPNVDPNMMETIGKLENLEAVVKQAWQEKVVAALTQETGEFTVNGQSYTVRLSGDLTNSVLASFLETVIGDIERDEQLKQGVYKLTMWIAEISGEDMEDAPKTADEFYGKLHERLEELKLVSFLETAIGDIEQDEQLKQEVYKLTMWIAEISGEDMEDAPKTADEFYGELYERLEEFKKASGEMVGRLNIYPISEQEALIDLTTPYSESVAKNVLLLTGGESTVVDVFETVFFDFSRPTPEDGSMPEVDFNELRQDADKNTISPLDMRMKMELISKSDQAILNVSALFFGTPFGASIDISIDGQTVRQAVDFDMGGETPLASLVQVNTPSSEAVEKIDLANKQKVVLNINTEEELDAFLESEEGQALMESLLTALKERIPTAYPQEGETILMLIEEAMPEGPEEILEEIQEEIQQEVQEEVQGTVTETKRYNK